MTKIVSLFQRRFQKYYLGKDSTEKLKKKWLVAITHFILALENLLSYNIILFYDNTLHLQPLI